MSAEFRDETTGRELAGLVIVMVGFGLLLNALGILPFASVIARFWLPATFVAIGVILLSKSHANEKNFGAFFLIGFGALLFIGKLNSIHMSMWQLLGPALVIWIGVSVLMKGSAFRPKRSSANPAAASNPNYITATAVLGSFEQRPSSQQFAGGELTAFMGGGKLDLRDAEIAGDEAAIDVFTVMGGMEIIVPEKWIVENRITAILGGVEDTTRPARDTTKRLILRGTALLGGVEVRNKPDVRN
jgi:predicted membrane protein